MSTNNPSVTISISTQSSTSLRILLYLYVCTPYKSSNYIVPREYLNALISWLEPIELPVPTVVMNQVHNISSNEVQRYLARRLSCSYETIQWCLKYEVWPMLIKSEIHYEY